MTKDELIEVALRSDILGRWHFFGYHFRHYLCNIERPLAGSIVDACLDCDRVIPGFAETMIHNHLATISGREMHWPHYEQLFQRLAELLVIRQLVTWDWPSAPTFAYEPTASKTRANPELAISIGDTTIGIEVKAPSLLEHQKRRGTNPIQVTARMDDLPAMLDQAYPGRAVTWPRDNPVKDFLISADRKFVPFKRDDPSFVGLLVVVWDDFINEPISALLAPSSGLFPPNSFVKDSAGQPVQFSGVDGVVLIRHLHQFKAAAAGQPPVDLCRHALDYGRPGEFPFKAYVADPHGTAVPAVVLNCLQAEPQEGIMGAEYRAGDLVWWFD